MEDLWKIDTLGHRLPDLADHAEYLKMIQRFRAEETRGHMQRLLYQRQPFHPDSGRDDLPEP